MNSIKSNLRPIIAMTTVLETFRIPPPPAAAAELTMPLSFFDITWLHFSPIRRLIFYDHPCSNSDFFNTIVPKLKHSLSLTLKHYLPVAGNLLYPSDTENLKPVFRYVSGDTVPLTVAVSGLDFDELVGNHARESDQFYDFMPPLPPVAEEVDYKIVPLIALQVTLFPGRGICIGLNNHHCLGDARSIVGFLWAWAEITKHGGDEDFQARNGGNLPVFDRPVFGDSGRLHDVYWSMMKRIPFTPPPSPLLPTKRVRASFILTQSDIRHLKSLVAAAKPALHRVSSFAVTAAYFWSSLAKSGDATGEEVGEDGNELFIFPADGRGRPNALITPPVAANYFGNCLGGGAASVEHKKLAAEDGFLEAAEAIAGEIEKRIYDGDEFLKCPEKQLAEMRKLKGARVFVVSGSPKFDFSEGDFGWGKGRKVEVLSLDGGKYSMSLCASDGGGLVAGLSLPEKMMEAFAAIFADGLNSS